MSLFNKKLSKSEVFALNQGAVITTPLRFSRQEHPSFPYKPGDEIALPTEDEDPHALRCRILDIESIRAGSGSWVNVRVTLRKS